MRFERGIDPKEAIEIGLSRTAMKILNIRFIITENSDPPGPGPENNVETCMSINEEYIPLILERLQKGNFAKAYLLEITEELKEKGDSGNPLHRWHLGTGLAGKVIKYKRRLYHIPEDLCKKILSSPNNKGGGSNKPQENNLNRV